MRNSLKEIYLTILPDVSSTTVEAVLGAMVKNGIVKRIGGIYYGLVTAQLEMSGTK